jgi:hypothetical protein
VACGIACFKRSVLFWEGRWLVMSVAPAYYVKGNLARDVVIRRGELTRAPFVYFLGTVQFE